MSCTPHEYRLIDLQRMIRLSIYLLTILERVAKRLETFYSRLSSHSIYAPTLEKNPARTRWNLIRRKIKDGSFFILTEEIQLHTSDNMPSPRAFRSLTHQDPNIDFQRAISQVKQAIDIEPRNTPNERTHSQHSDTPLRLADNHMSRATQSSRAPSSFEQHEQNHAMNRMSIFMDSNMQSIKRLSQLPSNIDFAHIMSVYGAKDNSRTPVQTPTTKNEERKMMARQKIQHPPTPRPQGQTQISGQHLHHRRPDVKTPDTTSIPIHREPPSSFTTTVPSHGMNHRSTARSRSTSTSSSNTSRSGRLPIIPTIPTPPTASNHFPMYSHHTQHQQPAYQQQQITHHQPSIPLHRRRQLSISQTQQFPVNPMPSPGGNGSGKGLLVRRKTSSLSGIQQGGGGGERKMVFPVIASGLV